MARSRRVPGAGAAATLALFATLATLAWQASRLACCEAVAVAVPATVSGTARSPVHVRSGPDVRAAGALPRAASVAARDAGLPALLRRAPADLRDSVLQAQSRRADGGRLYARYLLRECAAADAVAGLHAPEGDDPGRLAPPDATDPRVAHALAHVQQLRAACRQFTPAELSTGTNIVRNDGADADPLLARLDRFGAATADGRADLLRVLSPPDPLLLQEIGPRLLLDGNGGEQAYWFDGRRIAPGIAEPALALLPCALGLPCDDSDPQVWTACLQGQGCADSREELVLQRAAPDDPAARREILALARRIVQAVRAAEADRFAAAPPAGG